MGDSSLSQKFAEDIGLLKEVGINPIVSAWRWPTNWRNAQKEKH